MKKEKQKYNLGKSRGTLGVENKLWIKKFENGVKIRTKGEGEITLKVYEVYEMILYLRKFCKRFGGSVFFASFDLIPLWQKYTRTEEFIKRLLNDEVDDLEIEKIRKKYEIKKEKIKQMNKLKDNIIGKFEEAEDKK